MFRRTFADGGSPPLGLITRSIAINHKTDAIKYRQPLAGPLAKWGAALQSTIAWHYAQQTRGIVAVYKL